MKQYIGTKIIEAEPAYRCMDGQGRVTITDDPSEAFPNFPSVEDGYRVRYADGYVSWSPKDTFERAYLPLEVNTELRTSKPSISQEMVLSLIHIYLQVPGVRCGGSGRHPGAVLLPGDYESGGPRPV